MNIPYKFINSLNIPIRWLDLDPYGHVNNAKYFDYASETRINAFCEDFTNSKLHFVVAETHFIYKKSFRYPGTVLVEQYLKASGRAYMLFYYAFYLAGDMAKTLYAENTSKIVCVNPQTNKIVRLPEAIIARLK